MTDKSEWESIGHNVGRLGPVVYCWVSENVIDGWTLHQVRDPVDDCTSHKSREGGVENVRENLTEEDYATRVHVPWLGVGLSSGDPAKQPRAKASCWHPVMYHAAHGVLLLVLLMPAPWELPALSRRYRWGEGRYSQAWWNVCFSSSRKELGYIILGYHLVSQAFKTYPLTYHGGTM